MIRPTNQRVWFITGTSTGFGKYLVISALSRGDCVIATVRKLDDFTIKNVDQSRLHVITLDVTDSEESIRSKVDAAAGIWGRIDVLVNNAGYGVKTVIEEGGSKVAMTQFQTNFFGLINVTNAVLPYMRQRRSGTLVVMGSRLVWQAHGPTEAYYMASKAAVHAVTECYRAELAEFGIRVLLVAPGGFRTNINKEITYEVDRPIPSYEPLKQNVMKKLGGLFANAKGDPVKGMELVVDVVRGEGKAVGKEFPTTLLLGNAAYVHAQLHCERLSKTMAEWEDVSRNLDFEDDEGYAAESP
ncbi:uncharacterized protein C8Q71DRAFT_438143 [Rhodofomes roseus]|uniref:Uncharacterized protein n=1 Tax=Rhodofomes roseus TaxID=34475 RepID=A0A4Y9YJQ2_9APHY|nr:uncharacterized protein C8Q71DRAFT_438143 [Rhodofomes roseus]KAH9841081.1 hypothetical protein C8Q71DRAFT_438143 [Rhodofomes roseus]TFY62210.1 hypothetical protein EVJ58_g4010 [Rhodofomes roseus]